ncbi:hypothetical protein GGD70_007906 [Paraburkholderia fungorum]|nr:hypothetical protein [Paraburkholderia fungorum]
MSIYARIQNGIVAEIIAPMFYESGDSKGTEIPIADRFFPNIVATLVDVTSADPQPQCWWTAAEVDGAWSFGPPLPARSAS